MTEFVTLKDLADELGLDRSGLRRYALKTGIKPHKRRTANSANQLTLTVTPEEAECIKASRREEGFMGSAKVMPSEFGFFYVARLVPELDPHRIKVGFADDLRARLAQHKTAAPTITLVKSWPCKRAWEATAIDCVTAADCRLILSEVFECGDIDALVSRADQFFALLPAGKNRLQLSEHSPHNT